MASEHDILNAEHMKLGEYDGKRVGVKATMNKFSVNNIDEASSTVTYFGKESDEGFWVILKKDTSSGKAFTYATINNNASVTSYSSAWSARASLTYGVYSSAF